MAKKKWCVYKHTSPSGKVYIGITCRRPEDRWGQNGYGYYKQTVFYRAIKKYGWDNFEHEILYENLSRDDAAEKERKLIEEYKSNCSRYHSPTYGYNQTDGGEGVSGYTLSQDRKNWLSKKMKGEGNPFYGKHHSEETKKKLSVQRVGTMIGTDNPNYGNYWNEEQRKVASQQRIGNVVDNETKIKLSNASFGKNNPMYGKQQSNESIKKNKKNQPNAKIVKCVELNILFNSISECAKYFDTTVGSISSACRKKHMCKNYHFEFMDGGEDKINKKIKMFDKNMNYIKTFNNPKDASIALNTRINNIWNVLRGEQKTTCGYIFKYE